MVRLSGGKPGGQARKGAGDPPAGLLIAGYVGLLGAASGGLFPGVVGTVLIQGGCALVLLGGLSFAVLLAAQGKGKR